MRSGKIEDYHITDLRPRAGQVRPRGDTGRARPPESEEQRGATATSVPRISSICAPPCAPPLLGNAAHIAGTQLAAGAAALARAAEPVMRIRVGQQRQHELNRATLSKGRC